MKYENKNNKILDDLNKRNQNWTTIEDSLELKANKTYVDTKLSEKANKQQEEWITPTLLNGWSGNLKYMKDNMGSVFLMGSVLGGSDNTTAFTLPVGYRPQIIMYFIGRYAGSTPYSYYIHTNGGVVIRNIGTGLHYLDGVCFKAKEV